MPARIGHLHEHDDGLRRHRLHDGAFGAYERIPLSRAGLLEIHASPGTTVIERTIEQIKNP